MCERFTVPVQRHRGEPGRDNRYCFPSLKTKLAFFISRVTTESLEEHTNGLVPVNVNVVLAARARALRGILGLWTPIRR